jgi:hypothetical protein
MSEVFSTTKMHGLLSASVLRIYSAVPNHSDISDLLSLSSLSDLN